MRALSLPHPRRPCTAALLLLAVACNSSDMTSPSTGDVRVIAPAGETTAGLLTLTGRIAFESSRAGNYEIYKMNANGTGVTRLTRNAADDFSPTWSPDGNKIAFVSARAGNYEIYAMNADGTGVKRLTNNAAMDLTPAWSPNGAKIAFVSRRDGRSEIYVMNATGAGLTRLTKNLPSQCYSSIFNQCGESSPAWSPDGKRIVFAHKQSRYTAILETIRADGSGATPVPNTGPDLGTPAWGSTGKIAFVTSTGIFVIRPDGSGLVRLTNILGWGDEHPSWAPDGSKIAFSSNRTGETQIYAMNANGSGVTRLTKTSAVDAEPAWGH